jgi:hypothetical protein
MTWVLARKRRTQGVGLDGFPSPASSCKLNVDKSRAMAKMVNQGAVGVVCHSKSGDYLGALAFIFVGITNLDCLEVMTCMKALVLSLVFRVQGLDR